MVWIVGRRIARLAVLGIETMDERRMTQLAWDNESSILLNLNYRLVTILCL